MEQYAKLKAKLDSAKTLNIKEFPMSLEDAKKILEGFDELNNRIRALTKSIEDAAKPKNVDLGSF